MTFGHLVEIYQYLLVATAEIYALREEHRCVAMRIEGDDALMELAGLVEMF